MPQNNPWIDEMIKYYQEAENSPTATTSRARGRNKTPAERALELICTMAGVPFDEFQDLLKKSQGTSEREFPEKSYEMVRNNYFEGSNITKAQWVELYAHIKSPRTKFGKKEGL